MEPLEFNSKPFFGLLLGQRLLDVAWLVVRQCEGEYPLSGTVVFRTAGGGLLQVAQPEDEDVLQVMLAAADESSLWIGSGYDRPLIYHLESDTVSQVAVPGVVQKIIEFHSSPDHVYGAEFETDKGSFSLLMYPEDYSTHPGGAIWESVRSYGLEQNGSILITNLRAGSQP